MKDKNGIEICCENCDVNAQRDCCLWSKKGIQEAGSDDCQEFFYPSHKAYEARIAELQNELYVVQGSERVEAQEADRLRAEVKELEKKLTETIKLLSERSRECGELEAYNEVLQRRIREFSMELLDRTMKENKDVLERLKEAESEESHLEDFTIEEIDFIKKAISMAIFDCETNPPKPSDENLKLMRSIKFKCDGLLKKIKDEQWKK